MQIDGVLTLNSNQRQGASEEGRIAVVDENGEVGNCSKKGSDPGKQPLW